LFFGFSVFRCTFSKAGRPTSAETGQRVSVRQRCNERMIRKAVDQILVNNALRRRGVLSNI
jgi:hypothetical protein